MQAIYWQRYAEMELDEGNPSQAKLVFSRCLLSCPNVKLWTLYLRFIKKVMATLTTPREWSEYSVSLQQGALHRQLHVLVWHKAPGIMHSQEPQYCHINLA